MPFGKITESFKEFWPKHVAVIDEVEQPTNRWQSGGNAIEDDIVLGGRDWTDLSILVDSDTPLGRAVRIGQCYFSDEELSDALQGKSRSIMLTVVDHQPMFLNVAMISDIMIGKTIESVAA